MTDTDSTATVDALAEKISALAANYDHHSPDLSVDVIFDVYRQILDQPGLPATDAHGGYRLVARHADLTQVGKQATTFATGPGVMCPRRPEDPLFIPLELEGTEHAEVRQLYLDILGIRQVKEVQPYLLRTVEQLLKQFQINGGDFYTQVAARLPIDLAGELIGWDESIRSQLQQAIDIVLDEENPSSDPAAARAELIGLMHSQIAARRENPKDDQLTKLLDAKVLGEPISEGMLLMFTFVFAIAGYETTARALSSLVWYLATHPEVQGQLRTDPTLIANTVEEGLRMFPSAHTFFRTVTEPTELGGETLQPGEKVALLFGAANRDENVFEDPDTFCPDRSNARSHVAFGWGTHFCAGAHLARAEMRSLLEVLVRDYPPFELDGEPRWTPHLLAGNHMGVHYLPLRFVTNA